MSLDPSLALVMFPCDTIGFRETWAFYIKDYCFLDPAISINAALSKIIERNGVNH